LSVTKFGGIIGKTPCMKISTELVKKFIEENFPWKKFSLQKKFLEKGSV